MKIGKETFSADIQKQVSEAQGSGFELEDITSGVMRTEVKPKLITALLQGNSEVNTEYLSTDTYKYDEEKLGAAIPNGKAYSEFGKRIGKDKPLRRYFEVPSFGISFNVRPEDYANKRKPNTVDQFLTEDDEVAKLTMKAEGAWDNLDELGFAKLITEDTNLVLGGDFEEYNYYTEIVGGTRQIDYMDLTNGSIDHEQAFRKIRRQVVQDLARFNDSATMIVCICGDNFFDKRYQIQKNEGLQRPIKFGLDLASEPINESMLGTEFNYAWFDSQDGIRYINYGSEVIAGNQLIGTENAVMLPMGAESLIRVAYAPARTRTYVNTQAQELYTWSGVSERQGVSVWQESNKLFSLVNPAAIRHLNSGVSP